MSCLYIVASPIGNLEDITLRALRILREVDVIACEDTRHSSLLLNHYDIHKRLIACHSYNEEESAKGIIELLDEGKNIAYLSDAGTPGVSDPGSRLVESVRNETEHSVIPLPGASALTALISVSGNIGKAFTFEGFLSPKKGRREKRLVSLVASGNSFIIYESPFRVLKTLKELSEINGISKLVIGRELTKKHEEIVSGTPSEVYSLFQKRESIKGEFAILVVPGEAYDSNKETEEP